jgi:parallel beta-helix repeat protein
MYNSVAIILQSSDENIIENNNIFLNQVGGIHFYVSNGNTIKSNNIQVNSYGIRFDDSNSNIITENNLFGNLKNVFFMDCKDNTWNSNYWGRIRFLPKIITGLITIEPPGYHSPGKYLPWPNFDFRPAKRPFKIGE